MRVQTYACVFARARARVCVCVRARMLREKERRGMQYQIPFYCDILLSYSLPSDPDPKGQSVHDGVRQPRGDSRLDQCPLPLVFAH